jgi:transcriptional regulator with GAF, ATPase, and Fis domain
MQTTVTDIDTGSIDELNKEAWAINRKDAQKAIELSRKAYDESLAIGYKKGIAEALKTLGTAHIWVSKNEEAANYCFEAISIFNELGDKINEAETSYYVGANFYYLSDYDTAIKYYNRCFDINNEINYEPGMANGLNGLGTVYYTIEQNDKALDVLGRAHKLCLKNNTTDVLARVLDGLGETYYNLKEYDSALKYYKECIPMASKLGGFKQVEAFALDGLGRTYTGKKEFDEAFKQYNLSLAIRREIGFKFGEATTLNNIGNLFIEKGDLPMAIAYLEQSYDLAVKINSKEAIYKSSEKLAEIYEKSQRFEDAIKFFKIAHSAREEVRNEKTNQLVKSVELQHKMLQSQAEKLLLEEKAKELESYSDNLVLLGKIGQQIISYLSVAEIVDKVYEHVNTLMDATGFGIGLHKPSTDQIIYPLYIEGEDKYENIVYNLDDKERLTNICFNERREIIVNSDKEIELYIKTPRAPLAGKSVESIVYLPLIVKDKAMGVITVQSFKENAYTPYHVNILRNLAAFAAIALENAQMYEEQENIVAERTREAVLKREEVEKAYQNNRLLSEIGQQITSTLNFEEIFSKLHYFLKQLMDAACFGVRLYNPEKHIVEYKYGIERDVIKPNIIVSMDDHDNYSVWCIMNKKEIFINDNLTEYTKYTKQIRVVSGDLPHSLIFYPVMIGEKVLGVITVQSFEKNAYTQYHLDILKTLASYTAIALDNASLYENMEEKVKERTLEVVKQKEEVEKTYENTRLLSQLGKEITSTLSIEEINDKAYDNVNNLMDAFGFGIGVFNKERNEIVYPLYVEGEEKFRNIVDAVNRERLAGICYLDQKDIVINDFQKEIMDYVGYYQAPLEGQEVGSIIYSPLFVKEKVIGVITVQSLKKNAYTDYHVQIVKNLAVYVAIAIDNASLYSNMETRVKERTEEIEKNYNDTRLLSQIAEDVSASLSIQTIIDKVSLNINKLMKADCFGIGIFNPENNKLECKGFVENGKSLPDFDYDLTDTNRLATKCFINEEEIFINDYMTEYAKYIKRSIAPVIGKDSASIIYLPLYSKDQTIGIISVQSYEKNMYTSYHLNLLKNLAVSIGTALDNANLYQNLEEKVNERTLEVTKQKEEIEKTYENTRLLGQIGKDITSTLSIEEIISKVYASVNTLMDASVFGIGFFRPDLKRLIFSGTMENGKNLVDYSYLLTDDTLAVWAFNNEKDVFINDYEAEHLKYIKSDYTAVQGDDTVSMMFLPIFGKERKLGVISVQSFKKNAYTEYHLNILRNLSVHIGIALDNASLYEHLEEKVVERTAEVTKQKELLEKNFNDTKLVAQIIKDCAASLSIETIVSKVYENINKLMNAECFGMGLYNPVTQSIQFPGFIERSERMDTFEFFVKDKDRYAVWCFDNEKEIVIANNEVDYSKYLKVKKAPIAGQSPMSIVYLPLFAKDKKIGVLTVQSFVTNAYSEYQVNILRSITASIAIALDNASLYTNLEEKVKERTAEVHEQKAIIEEKNKDITDSIKYAQKIQLALIPDEDILKAPFPDSFIYYKPKDIVSGDFYWIENFADDVTVFAVADCTGHGVPGAFMSLICIDLMSQVIKDQNVTTPGQALAILDHKVRSLLNKSSDNTSNDGMDIALCAYHKSSMTLQYAGAHRPLLLIRNGELIEYRASKHSIGGYLMGNKIFDDNHIQLQKGDCVYVLTDGFSDQFGGESGKKFKFKKLQKYLQTIAHMPMDDQHDLLEEAFISWRGKHEQVDDVCVIGIRV